jgi:hypothetical protein
MSVLLKVVLSAHWRSGCSMSVGTLVQLLGTCVCGGRGGGSGGGGVCGGGVGGGGG